MVLGETTFRAQAKTYLQWVQTRDREPIKDASSIEAALNKWILPAIGDLPLADVHNITVKPPVDRMKKAVAARTVNKYVEYIGQIVASLKNGRTGEPIHRRTWDRSVMDLPVVNPKRQRRPALRLDAINTLLSGSTERRASTLRSARRDRNANLRGIGLRDKAFRERRSNDCSIPTSGPGYASNCPVSQDRRRYARG